MAIAAEILEADNCPRVCLALTSMLRAEKFWDGRAASKVAQALLRHKWQPSNDEELVWFSLATGDLTGLQPKRGRAIDLLSTLIASDIASESLVRAAAIATANLGFDGARAVDALLRRLFLCGDDRFPNELHGFVGGSALTTAMVELATLAASVDTAKTSAAVRDICQIISGVSDNLLHLVAQKADKVVVARSGEFESDEWGGRWRYAEHKVSFEKEREVARRELAKRGNPPYRLQSYSVRQGHEKGRAT